MMKNLEKISDVKLILLYKKEIVTSADVHINYDELAIRNELYRRLKQRKAEVCE